jgi:hypothetical protein
VPLLGWPLALGVAPLLLATGVPLCGFRHLTGQPCPLCGGTHACAALAQGDLMVAWQANPGLIPLFVIAAAHAAQLAWEAWLGRRVTRWRIGPSLVEGGRIVPDRQLGVAPGGSAVGGWPRPWQSGTPSVPVRPTVSLSD